MGRNIDITQFLRDTSTHGLNLIILSIEILSKIGSRRHFKASVDF